MTRRLVCDVPHCGHTRLSWQRLCGDCYRRLPGEIRVGIAEAKRERRTAHWQQLCRRAAEYLNIDPVARVITASLDRIPPERVFELHQRMLGERSDT